MAFDYDVIVIGSGFGGAVCAYRLAKAGRKVLVLERGRRWAPKAGDGVTAFPRNVMDPWLWDDRCPEKCHGWFDFRRFDGMSVVQGAGVGGGSLVYANISVDAKPDTFASGWPQQIKFETLVPHYNAVRTMLDSKPVPKEQWPERTKLLREAARRAGYTDKFRPLELAVRFDRDYHYGLDDPHHEKHSKASPNAFGIEQGTCIHLGNCDIGCDVNARNSLDLNYLAGAERQHGATILPLRIVRHIAPSNGGYEVRCEEIVTENGQTTLKPDNFTAGMVIVAAGSLGSTEILLRSRAAGVLPKVSGRLGHGWSSNGDFLTPALHFFRKPPVQPTRGPTITAAIDLLDGEYKGHHIFVEDGGFPDIARQRLQRLAAEDPDEPWEKMIVETLRVVVSGGGVMQHVMPWFAQARDAADGRLLMDNGRLSLDWKIDASRDTMEAVASLHRKLAYYTAGMPLTPLTWTTAQELITPHPLGGCNMGSTEADGVVDHTGQVFNYPNLYVADGAIVPKAIGLNPSKTIAALAEHIAAGIVAGG